MAVESNEKKYLAIDRVTAVNCFDLAPEFVTDKNSHDAWEFVYVDGGRIRCYTKEREVALSQGQMIFHRPREVHSTVCMYMFWYSRLIIWWANSWAMVKFLRPTFLGSRKRHSSTSMVFPSR